MAKDAKETNVEAGDVLQTREFVVRVIAGKATLSIEPRQIPWLDVLAVDEKGCQTIELTSRLKSA